MIKKMSSIFMVTALICMISSSLIAITEKDVIAKAIDFYEKRNEILFPKLGQDLQNVYAKDLEYINEFPFQAYSLVDVPTQGLFYDDHINDYIKNVIRQHAPWEPDIQSLIKEYTLPGTVALDIGAHIGTHSITMAECVGSEGLVLAFEPNKKIYRELCMNLAINNKENIIPLRYALGKEEGIVEVITPLAVNEGGSYVIKAKEGSNTAVVLPLDSFQLTNVSFIKIDVENMEGEVLEGAMTTIQNNRPIILLEIQGNFERPIQLKEDSAKMAFENKLKLYDLDYRLIDLGIANYLALPNEAANRESK